eukprot:m.89001 g.89001  ORF g.89001 m.89001 type:complete len:453 (-) comp15210_c0_seq1:177-1535(-)
MADSRTAFTCISCGVGFPTSEDQRTHYKTDWHRYNLKRKVAGMLPVTAASFRERVLQQQADRATAAAGPAAVPACECCAKQFSSENAYKNHINSNKHKEALALMEKKQQQQSRTAKTAATSTTNNNNPTSEQQSSAPMDGVAAPSNQVSVSAPAAGKLSATTSTSSAASKRVEIKDKDAAMLSDEEGQDDDEDDDDEDGDWEDVDEEEEEGAANMDEDVDETEELKSTLKLSDCIFCTSELDSFEASLKHMASTHSFFVPDMEFLVDMEGLIGYLQQKVSAYYVCIYCNKIFNSLDATRKHMAAKGHCKIDYSEDGALEVSEYYDFSSSYPDWQEAKGTEDNELALPNGMSGVNVSDAGTLGLELPSGAVAGHRDLRRYYRQRFRSQDNRDSVVTSRVLAAHRAIGMGDLPVITEEQKRVRDRTTRREQYFRERTGIRHNALQFHYREQLLQ